MSRMFGWDYPPGVTGNEFEIAGADYEQQLDDECPKCLKQEVLIELGYRYQRWVECSNCDYREDLEPLTKDD